MKTIKELLDEEIDNSTEFAKKNFGQPVGENFTEVIKQVSDSKKVFGHLMLDLIGAGIFAKEVADSMKRYDTGGTELDTSSIIRENSTAFSTPLSFLYWGIEIGRKLEKQEIEELNKLNSLGE